MIVVDPRDSDVVYVAAQGPLWAPGGDRGLYKTTDGGETWEQRARDQREHRRQRGASSIRATPTCSTPSAYQRRRHVWTLINGGPESAIYKSTDGGATWTQARATACPSVRHGPHRPGHLARRTRTWSTPSSRPRGDEGGFFRSTDAGANWEKRSDYVSGSPQYYQRDRRRPAGRRPRLLPGHLDAGHRGRRQDLQHGRRDATSTWTTTRCGSIPTTPTTCSSAATAASTRPGTAARPGTSRPTCRSPSSTRSTSDNDCPFYNVYGGTQDNNTLGGPSPHHQRARHHATRDWFITVGGDGFETAGRSRRTRTSSTPSASTAAWCATTARAARRSTSSRSRRRARTPLRWNWDSPLIISPHSHTRLYFAAQTPLPQRRPRRHLDARSAPT